MLRYCLFAIVALQLAGVLAAPVQLSESTFDAQVEQQPTFVKFFAPWCGHCKRLEPTWHALADKVDAEIPNVKIATVDCTVESGLCNKNNIRGYPTLILFKTGEQIAYQGGRNEQDLLNFVKEKTA
uniref:Thioredoxin domain-containing protein n=1 Tax=Hanusia phi TaxID=3032 RepID=A0A7S0EYX9_9CRYP